MIEGLAPVELATPEAPWKWSISAVVQHLADAELVWGYRLRMVMAEDRLPIVGYDQGLWSSRLHHQHADIQDAREQFAASEEACKGSAYTPCTASRHYTSRCSGELVTTFYTSVKSRESGALSTGDHSD